MVEEVKIAFRFTYDQMNERINELKVATDTVNGRLMAEETRGAAMGAALTFTMGEQRDKFQALYEKLNLEFGAVKTELEVMKGKSESSKSDFHKNKSILDTKAFTKMEVFKGIGWGNGNPNLWR